MNVMRWGLIGCGDIARRRVVPALSELESCELIAVSRARSELAQAFAQEFGVPKWYADWRELLKDADIDAVYIATPVYLHASQVIAAAEAGKHILCEKPMALNSSECVAMLDACRAQGVTLGIAYYRHFYPIIERIKQLLAQGTIGTPVVAQINVFGWFDPPPDDPRHWLIERVKSGGGPMMDVGCHRIELLLDILGPITRVSSLYTNAVFTRMVEDTASALFRFPSGASAVLTITHAAQEPQDTFNLFGSAGSLHVPALNAGTLVINTQNETRQELHPCPPNPHKPLLADFVDAVLAQRQPLVNGTVGLAVAQLQDEMNKGFQ